MREPRWATRTSLGEQFWRNGKAGDCPVIDAHGHMGPWKGIYFPHAEPAQMVHSMDRAGVRIIVFSHHSALSSPDVMNRMSVEASRANPERFRAYCLFHPVSPLSAEEWLADYERFADVFVGVKLHGDMHGVAYTDPRYAPAWEFAEKRRLPVLVHSWGDSPRTGAAVMRVVAEKYPHVKLILGHSLHNRWSDAVAVAREFPHVSLDLCAVLDERTGVLERFVGELGSERILFGTDLPWFDLHYYIAGVVAAEITEADMRNILFRNAQRLFSLSSAAGSGEKA